MLLIGLTGGIATGKSTVSKIFIEHGCPVIDADLIAREVVRPGQIAYKKLRSLLGDEFFDDESGELLRKKLGQIVFTDNKIREAVNSITHPEIRKVIAFQIMKFFFEGQKYVILDLPLLFEAGYDRFLQKIVVVYCSEEKQLHRLQQRDSITEAEARSRIQSQYPLSEKARRADVVIDNNGDRQSTRIQGERLIEELNSSHLHLLIKAGFILLIFTIVYLTIYIYKCLFR